MANENQPIGQTIMNIPTLFADSTINISHLIGEITFFVLVAILIIWGIAKAVKK